MFSCELKFVIDILKKCLSEKYYKLSKELEFFTKQKFKRENPIDWEEKNCVICGFHLPAATSNFLNGKVSTYVDFVS